MPASSRRGRDSRRLGDGLNTLLSPRLGGGTVGGIDESLRVAAVPMRRRVCFRPRR